MLLPQRNAKCVEKLTHGEPSPTTRVGSRRSKCLEMPEELSRRKNLTTATTTQADLSRHALELKLSRPGPPHPSSGRSASEGMKPKERQKPLRVGASKGEVGRVSQEGKVAQARKDSGDR